MSRHNRFAFPAIQLLFSLQHSKRKLYTSVSLAGEHLRDLEYDCSRDTLCCVKRTRFGKAEISKLGIQAFVMKEDILVLQVAVHNSSALQEGDAYHSQR